MNSLCILYVLAIISASFAADIPNSFDAREAWPQCADIIGQVRDQSQCGGAGWAFGSIEAMSDRICIHSNATIKVHVSADDLITCCPDCANGCKRGGSATTAWNYWVSEGITTGGLYNATREGCKSYWLPPCTKPNVKDCSVTILPPTCSASCDDSSLDYEEQKTYGKGVSTFKGEEEIKKEIITNGPVTATINQFIDLYDYAKGVYAPASFSMIQTHGVKIIGWGEQNGVEYWLIANSWGANWGEDGFVKIKRNAPTSGVEYDVVAGLPDFDKF